MINKGIFNTAIIYIAESLILNEKLKNELRELYKSDKYRFYNKAKQSELYFNSLVSLGSLEREVDMKRTLGILLSAEDDELLKQKVLKIMSNYYRELYIRIKNKKNDFNEYIKSKISEFDPNEYVKMNSFPRIAYYIIKLIYGFNVDIKQFEAIIQMVEKDILQTENFPVQITNMHEEKKEISNSILDRLYTNFGRIESIKDLIVCYERSLRIGNEAEIETGRIYCFMALLFDFEKLSISNQLSGIELTKDDLLQIASAYNGAYKDKNLERSHKFYIFGMVLKSLIKAYKGAKDFYFSNNAETQFIELQNLQNKIQELELSKDAQFIELNNLKSEKKEWDSKLKSEISLLEAQHKSEVRELKKEIEKLKDELMEEQKKNFEINKLREFVFSIKQEYVPQDTEINLSELIKDKKIVIIGGHENWRKKLKDIYPSINTIDGFNEGFDVKLISQADFVFLHTGYMNHGTYYRAINTLRAYNIPFNYLGRTNNELVEKEMAESIKELMIKE